MSLRRDWRATEMTREGPFTDPKTPPDRLLSGSLLSVKTNPGPSVTRSIPSYLRLHTGDSTSNRIRGDRPRIDRTQRFWSTFTAATGWAIQPRRNSDKILLRPNVESDQIWSDDELIEGPTISKTQATALAEAAAELCAGLKAAEATMREQEAIVAAAEVAPVTPEPESIPHGKPSLADRLSAVLAEACESLGGIAAGLYMLNDKTSELKLRAHFGLDRSAFSEAARPLRGSLADLEALVGEVVDVGAGEAATLGLPENPALCVAVMVGDTPVGTLWFWNATPEPWSAAQKATARLTARLISHELIADNQQKRAEKSIRATQPLRAAASWQQRQQPGVHEIASGWKADGWVSAPLALASSWYHWDVLPDGLLAFVIAEAHASGYEGAMIAATARAAWQSHSGYRHSPPQMLRRISDTLWATNTAEQKLSINYLQIDPDTGEGTLASAGELTGLIASQYGVRPLGERTQPLGIDFDAQPSHRSIRLDRDEMLIAVTPGLCNSSSGMQTSTGIPQHELVNLIRAKDAASPAQLLARLRRKMAPMQTFASDRTAMVIGRT